MNSFEGDPFQNAPLPDDDPRAQAYDLIGQLREQRTISYDQSTFAHDKLILEAATEYLGQEHAEVGEALYDVMHIIAVHKEQQTNPKWAKPDITIHFLPRYRAEDAAYALSIGSNILGQPLTGVCGDATFSAFPDLLSTPEMAVAAWSAEEPDSSLPYDDPRYQLYDVLQDIRQYASNGYNVIRKSVEDLAKEVGKAYIDSAGSDSIALSLLEHIDVIEAFSEGLTDYLAEETLDPPTPINARPGEGIWSFARVLELAAKVKGQTLVGIHNKTLIILTPETAAIDAIKDWEAAAISAQDS